jgi:hypothetical protein
MLHTKEAWQIFSNFSLKTGKEETTWHKWGNNIKVDHKKWDAKMQTGFTWHKIRVNVILLWTLCHFAFYKRLKIS